MLYDVNWTESFVSKFEAVFRVLIGVKPSTEQPSVPEKGVTIKSLRNMAQISK